MSGPKRADVQAALNTAARSAQAAGAAIAAVERGAVGAMTARSHELANEISSAASALRTRLAALRSLAEHDQEAVATLRAAEAVVTSLEQSTRGRDDLQGTSHRADAAERDARAAYDAAQAEYDKAEQAFRRSGSGHYLHDQMAWARGAKHAFERAGVLAREARDARSASTRVAGQAVAALEGAAAEGRRMQQRVESAIRAAEDRARAAAEAAKIAEERRRRASQQLAGARIAVEGLDAGLCDKFVPGARQRLENALSDTRREFDAGRWEQVGEQTKAIVDDVTTTATAADTAKAAWDSARAVAVAATQGLTSLISSVDADLVRKWSDNRTALRDSETAILDASAALEREDFDHAREAADRARDALAADMSSAAAAQSQDLRRREIGDAVMDVLEDLGFDVSHEDGSRDDPLRISGQTASADGRGDFDIEIPLDGEIDFEVTASEGDNACVNAVQDLQKKLSERGIAWQVTDWGHADPAAGDLTKTKQKAKTRTQTRSQSSGG